MHTCYNFLFLKSIFYVFRALKAHFRNVQKMSLYGSKHLEDIL